MTLIQRLQDASEGSRELDAAIQVALTPDAKCMTHPGGGTVGSSFGPMSDIDWSAWEELNKQRPGTPFYYGEPPAYTTSIDAAMTLGHDDWQRAEMIISAMSELGNPDYMQEGKWLKLMPIHCCIAALQAGDRT